MAWKDCAQASSKTLLDLLPESRKNSTMTDQQIELTINTDISRRNLMRDVLAATGWVLLGGAELSRSAPLAIAGDRKNVAGYGGLKGRIVFDGAPPARTEIDFDKLGLAAQDLQWFKSGGTVLNEDWVVDPSSKAIQWVYVWLQPLDKKDKFQIHESRKVITPDQKVVVIDQEPRGYVPHAAAMREGQNLLMRNMSPITHVFNYTGFSNASFNRAMPPKSEALIEHLRAERTISQVNCPPHPWERMSLRIFEHPYFAVTQADGTFEFDLVPEGPCRLVVWHEKLGFRGGREGKNGSEVAVTGGATTDLGDIAVKPTEMS